MPKYIVLGASSFIGKNFYKAFKKDILLATSNNIKKKNSKNLICLRTNLNLC